MSSGKSKPRGKDFMSKRVEALHDISIEMMSATQFNDVLNLILKKSLELLVCDAASIYLKKDDQHLVFEVAINNSMQFDFERTVVPLSANSLATYVFRTGETVRLPDVYKIPKTKGYSFDPSYDKKSGYHTKSVLVHPLKTSKSDTIGVLQLINRKHDYNEKWPVGNAKKIHSMPSFNAEDAYIIESFAAIASAGLENAQLRTSIADLFESFVTASVQAIEVRDPTTKGHSERVALLTVDLAHKVSRSLEPELSDIRFNESQIAEIRYASLLHDFGKISISEATLQKEEKLQPIQKLSIRSRFDEFMHANEIQSLRQYIHKLLSENRAPTSMEFARIEKEIKQFRLSVEDMWALVLELNQPSILDKERSTRLDNLTQCELPDCSGHKKKVLSEDESFCLSIKRGSLTKDERIEIENHVTFTYKFLKRIPWTKELQSVPEIAFTHHEMLNGTGYPRQLKEPNIPIQARMMTVCDIFDALVANDRPYKPALPIERALDILNQESKNGRVDQRLFKVFLEARIYENPLFLQLSGPTSRKAA